MDKKALASLLCNARINGPRDGEVGRSTAESNLPGELDLPDDPSTLIHQRASTFAGWRRNVDLGRASPVVHEGSNLVGAEAR